jgi:glycosyltransferase involved in cell wall biosynthesis
MRISVVIPTLNEAENLDALLARLGEMDSELEIIVADGGSSDGTADIAGARAAVVNGRRGRGAQMNRGAAAATGDYLWFT